MTVSRFGLAQARSRDVTRKTNLQSLGKALFAYYVNHYSFPTQTDLAWGERLVDDDGHVYMKPLPDEDFRNNPQYCYQTKDDSLQKFAIFSVLENQEDPDYNKYCEAGYEACDSVYNYVTFSLNTSAEDFGLSCVPLPVPTDTPVPPTSTPVPPTSTPVPGVPTSTPVPGVPTSTPVPGVPTSTPVPPTSTPVPGVPTSTPVPPTSTPVPGVTNTPVPSYDCVYYECGESQAGCFASDPCPAGDVACGYGCPAPDFDDWCVGAYDYGQGPCDQGEHSYGWFECTLYPGQGDGESLWCSSEPDGWDGDYYPTATPTSAVLP